MQDETEFAKLQCFRSIKTVRAGMIVNVSRTGCQVRQQNGEEVFLSYAENMTARYTPTEGDYWVVYSDGYQSLSPREMFEEGYVVLEEQRP